MRSWIRSSACFSSCGLWQLQLQHHLAVICTVILVSLMWNMKTVEALAATSRPFGSGFGGGGGGSNTNKSKKQTRRKQQQTLYFPDTSATTQDLVSFCKNVMEFEGIEGTEIGFSTKHAHKMRGLYATDSFSPGEFILGIPFVGCLTLARDELSAKDKVNDAELGYRLLQRMNKSDKETAQQQQEQAQSWNPYFQSLPCMNSQQSHFDSTPDFFTLDEIQALQCPILIQKAMNRKRQIQQLVARLLLLEEEQEGGIIDNSFELEVDERQLQFATWLVKSRGFTLLKPVRLCGSSSSRSATETSSMDDSDNKNDDDSSLSRKAATSIADEDEGETNILLSKTVLIPYMDMINHSPNPNCELVVVETKAEEESFYSLQAIRPIAKGKEITIAYGVGGKQQEQQPDSGINAMIELFANYGFLSPLPSLSAASRLVQRDNLNDSIDDGLFTWTTTLKEDEQLLNELIETTTTVVQDMPLHSNMRKVLEFRIHMKHAQQQQHSDK